MAYKINLRLHPPKSETALADVEALEDPMGLLVSRTGTLLQNGHYIPDGKAMIVALTYEDKDTCDKHSATEPEDYLKDIYDTYVMGEATP